MESTLEKLPDEPESPQTKPTPRPKPSKKEDKPADVTLFVRSHVLTAIGTPKDLHDVKVIQLYETDKVWRCRVNVYFLKESTSLIPKINIEHSYFVHYDAADDKIISSSPQLPA